MKGSVRAVMYDVVVVGGSVAGAAAAAFLARRGRSVLVLEKSNFPRDKACGEGVLPHGAEVLRRLGVTLPGAVPIRGLRYRLGARTLDVPFDRPGLAVRRRLLDDVLLRHAQACGAVVRRELVRSVRDLPGRILIGADGANSLFHRAFGLHVTRTCRRVGFTMHWADFECERDRVEVVLFGRGEVYIAPVDSGLTLVAVLAERSLGLRPEDLAPLLRRLLPDRMRCATLVAPVLASAPLSTRVEPIAGDHWMLVGDSAGRLDPVTGQGISLALVAAGIAAEAADAALDGRDTLSTYVRRVIPLRRRLETITNLVLFAARRPWLARQVLRRALVGPLMRCAVTPAR